MSKKLFIVLVIIVLGAAFSAVSAGEINARDKSDNIKNDIVEMINGIGGELSELGIPSSTEPGQTGGDSVVSCVDVNVALPDTVFWENPFGGGLAEGHIELANCGDMTAEIQIGISIAVNISYLIDTTFILPPFSVWLGAGETVLHQYYFSVPPVEGEVTVCVLASTDGVENSDCATTVITGSGSTGFPYQGQGVLVAGTGCILFAPAGDSNHAFVLENYGGFVVYDTVFVTGYLIWGCDTDCPEAIGCINDNTIDEASNPGMPFESCGILTQIDSCLLFIPTSGNEWPFDPNDTCWQMILTLENYGIYQAGDTVNVAGTLIMAGDPNCPMAIGQLVGNSIEYCDEWPSTPFSGCGLLVQGAECVLFAPLADSLNLYVLDNYGSFNVGDTVLVNGYLVMDCSNICMEGNGCVVDNQIDSCATNPGYYIERCGVLIDNGTCLLFEPFEDIVYSIDNLFYIENTAGFGNYDTVYVAGQLILGCEIFCDTPIVGCIVDNSIDTCTGDTTLIPFDGCGILSVENDCVLFSPVYADSIDFMLDSLFGYSIGDTISINGWLDIYCNDSCSMYGCLEVVDISYCDTSGNTYPYEACGVLLENQYCLLFAPLGDYYTRILLDNYGGYGVGDTVYVAGMLQFACQHNCGDTAMCLLDNTIGECYTNPTDSIFFEGCGLMVEDSGCLLFNPYEGYVPQTMLAWTGSFGDGDEVYVSGIIYPDYDTTCGSLTVAYMYNDIIQICDTLPPDTVYYSGCGYLADDTGCVRFFPFMGDIPPAVLSDYGTFTIGDEVYVSGYLAYNCNEPCAYGPYICLDNDTILGCNQTEPYEACGLLVTISDCLLFYPLLTDSVWTYRFAAIGPYVLDNYGSFGQGDTVFVQGELNPYCTTSCAIAAGCIEDNSITECQVQPPDTVYAGCGVLINDTLNCLKFYPMGGFLPPLLLTDYGSFADGDTVMAEGTLDLIVGCECAGIMQPCLDNWFIGLCGDDSTPAAMQIEEKLDIQIYPNPFNPTATISFYIPTAAIVNLKVYNILGQEVETLINDENILGQRTVEWNGAGYGSGVYFYRMEAGNITRTGKMVLTK